MGFVIWAEFDGCQVLLQSAHKNIKSNTEFESWGLSA